MLLKLIAANSAGKRISDFHILRLISKDVREEWVWRSGNGTAEMSESSRRLGAALSRGGEVGMVLEPLPGRQRSEALPERKWKTNFRIHAPLLWSGTNRP
ncbi:hypothetical protein AAFF_G00417430 [Aldrovandia affinis]|uniref:Uncharacterized protein n=1 Tax=Aldrovandia affinis TaxID=143900 RepID=A0AAD7WJD1_9TELE|nr:hypothetical protein AAFF_G00417430 [Aldrovandia affinis]